jgi:hypothetical protein
MPDRTRSTTQLGMRCTAAGHILRSFAFTISLANVIETHEHKGEFKE